MMRVAIAGGSGLIGRRLSASLIAGGHAVRVLSRNVDRARSRLAPSVEVVAWDPEGDRGALADALKGTDAVVNLAGETIGGRPWTPGRKRAILVSRVRATEAIVEGIERLPAGDRPVVLVNASGIDVYGDRRVLELAEDGHTADTFLARVSLAWEAAARDAERLGLRVVLCRTAFVIAADAPAFRLLTLPYRLFLGGRLGRGDQPVTWIHVDDVVGLYSLALLDPSITGPLNLVAPETPPQRAVARAIGRVLGRPAAFPAPAALLRLALWGQADLLLHGRRALPAKAAAAGYVFRYPALEPALREALGRP
jgi:uncharacterized protein (TIGR01777 family)